MDAGLNLRLADGRRLRLAGVDPAGPTPDAPDLADLARADLAALVGGRTLLVAASADRPDRWGRIAAAVSVQDAAGPRDLAEAALAVGLGRYLPEEAAHGCRDALLAAEAIARAARRGVWRDGYYGVLAASDSAALQERSATLVVAEGRVESVESGPFRTLLRLAPLGALTAAVSPRVGKVFERQGVVLAALAGRRVRLRGLLDTRFGPRIELAGPDALEILDAASAKGGGG